jgi:Raf kinase inhibitor-like YbhB/YbcL family protein
MILTSHCFADGSTIPSQFTADGANASPALAWSGAPGNTKSFALICEDPDAPRGTWIHWVVYNLPPDCAELPESVSPNGALPTGAEEGSNSWSKVGYGGPSPPPGKPHRYIFRLFALDAVLKVLHRPTKAQLEQAMKGHILASAQWLGKYGRS